MSRGSILSVKSDMSVPPSVMGADRDDDSQCLLQSLVLSLQPYSPVLGQAGGLSPMGHTANTFSLTAPPPALVFLTTFYPAASVGSLKHKSGSVPYLL